MRTLLRVVISLLGLSSLAFSLPQVKRETCAVRSPRKSWTALTADEKSSYINATLCLQKTPAKAGIKGARTRWDELQYTHIAQSDYIHTVAAFLPWHRYFLKVHEVLIRNECGYKGPMPYWDEAVDAANLIKSPLFDPTTGFGGDGWGVFHCITDGPFANLTLHFAGDLSTNVDYCIIRIMNNCFFNGASQKFIDACMAKTTFEDAWHCLEGQPHGAGHGGVGGIMVNVQLSPGDPLFWLHHAWLDSLWWRWQSQDLAARVADMSGPNLPFQLTFNISDPASFQPPPGVGPPPGCFGGLFPTPNGTFPLPNGTSAGNVTRPGGGPPVTGVGAGGNGTNPFGAFPFQLPTENKAITDYFNDSGGRATTMNHTLWSAGIFPNATISDVMDNRGPFLCVDYI